MIFINSKIQIIKKTGKLEDYNFDKIINAVGKSAERANVTITENIKKQMSDKVEQLLNEKQVENISVSEMHTIVECVLDEVNPKIAKSYRDYRNYKKDFTAIMDNIFQESRNIRYIADKENANSDATLASTQRSLLLKKLSKELYQKFELTAEELQDIRDGYYYIHDIGDRLFTLNCCLFDMENVLKGGFEMANIHYTEPKSVRTAMAVMSDVTLAAAAQQYGGFTVPEIDNILEYYCHKSYNLYVDEYYELFEEMTGENVNVEIQSKADIYAMKKIERDLEQGFQEWEYKFNTLSSSRGDYPKNWGFYGYPN